MTNTDFQTKRNLVKNINLQPYEENFTELFAMEMFRIWGYPIEIESLHRWMTAHLIREIELMTEPPTRH